MRLPATALPILLLAFACADRASDPGAPDYGSPDPASPEGLAATVEIVRDTWGCRTSTPHRRRRRLRRRLGPGRGQLVAGRGQLRALLGTGVGAARRGGVLSTTTSRGRWRSAGARSRSTERAREMRALYDAYAAGFNFYSGAHPDAERRLLERVEPWHTLALIRFKYHHNEYIGYAGLRRAARSCCWSSPTTAAPASRRRDRTRSRWPDPTASGHPMLLINPHVPFFGMSQYWEVHLQSDEGSPSPGSAASASCCPTWATTRRWAGPTPTTTPTSATST